MRGSSPGASTDRVIVIDVGKTFFDGALELFPRHDLRRIDAVLLTHGHADGESMMFHLNLGCLYFMKPSMV